MPELPEVETTRRGIMPHIVQKKIKDVIVRQPQLRWPIPQSLSSQLKDNCFLSVNRRGKYLLLNTDSGTLIIHLGMSGSLRLCKTCSPKKHDHVDIIFNDDTCLRYTDPRRFGSLLWTSNSPHNHQLLEHLGVEPLQYSFSPSYLYNISRQKRCSIKSLIMNSQIVAGVGNIYANEALFAAKIAPTKEASRLNQEQYRSLTRHIKIILQKAIKAGGTTLKDFTSVNGKPGYFSQQLHVYGKENQPCPRCSTTLKSIKQHQRKTTYCPQCQPE